MNRIKSVLLASAAMLALGAAAQAADLPTKKAPPAPAPAAAKNCLASFATWLDSTAADCPLSAAGVTVYGQIDVGVGYESNAAAFNPYYPNGVQEIISKQSHGGAWQLVPNGISQSNIGVKIKEPVAGDVSLIGDVNLGFDPYSLRLTDGPMSLYSNNAKSLADQTANGDSSRAGQIDNARGYLGVSSATLGTLTFGRQYAFTNSLSAAYDPFGAAYAFSLASSGTLVAGTGATETGRMNTSVEYLYDYNKVAHAGALVQLGGYDQGNGSQQAYQLDVGANFAGFSVDAIYGYAKDAMTLSTLGGSTTAAANPLKYAADGVGFLPATLQDISSEMLLAKYTWGPTQLFGGYVHADISGIGSDYKTGALIGGEGDYSGVVANVASGAKTTYPADKILQTVWVGAKYAVRSDIEVMAGYYHSWQNDYRGSTATATGSTSCQPATSITSGGLTGTGLSPQGTASAKCAGTTDMVSFAIDYRPVKRLDVYAGVAYSVVGGGMATGFTATSNLAPTAGLRLSF